MNNIAELFTWAEMHHYPQLVLNKDDVIKPGIQAWLRLNSQPERVEKAIQRIKTFQNRYELKQAS